MDPIATAHYGMFAATQQFARSADQIVQAGAGEPTDMAQAVVDMASAEAALKATPKSFAPPTTCSASFSTSAPSFR